MNSDRLIYKNLSKLDATTLKKFGFFLASPYFNQNTKVIALFERIEKYQPDFALTKQDENKIKDMLFKDNVNYFAVVLSQLNQLFEEFQVIERLWSKETYRQYAKTEFYLETLEDSKYYDKLISKSKEVHTNFELLELSTKETYLLINFSENHLSDKSNMIYELSHKYLSLLTETFIGKYLEIYNNIYSLSEAKNIDIQHMEGHLSDVLSLYAKNQQDTLSLTNNYVQLLKLFKSMDDEVTFKFHLSSLQEEIGRLPVHQLNLNHRHILLLAKNACILKAYEHQGLYKEVFDITKFLLERKLYFKGEADDQFSKRFILNIKIGIINNDIPWVKQFADEYLSYFPVAIRTEFKRYANGLINFQEKNYEECLKSLIKVTLSDNYFLLDYKLILLKVYFELNDSFGFQYLSKTHKKYLQKDKSLNVNYVKNIFDIILFIKILFRGKKQDIDNELKKNNITYLIENYRDKWFREKYQQLLNQG
ncbi:MAG: hypothetical protein K1X55_04205 [Chitinophagales bacterium]|nr:hypothetical protein [Chitinophagales bacterium]